MFRLGGITILAVAMVAACSPRRSSTFSRPAKPRHEGSARQLHLVEHTSLPNPDMETEAQISNDGVLRVQTTSNSKLILDLVTDGEREFLLNDQGVYEEVHGDAHAVWTDWQQRCSPDFSKLNQGDALLVGQEQVAGQTATVYTWTERKDTMSPIQVRVWIAEVGLQPLKIETRHDLASPFTHAPYLQTDTTTYGYDPTIRVMMPEPGSRPK